jgi:hypothetical protein
MDHIKQTFQTLSNQTSDINEHLPTLSKYASECKSVFETGVRGCVSSWAFVHGLLTSSQDGEKTLFMNDIDVCHIDDLLNSVQGSPIRVSYEWKNNLELNFAEGQTYDLTFIDTWHVYGQLKRELAKFAPITNKYIIMHDTSVDEWEGETIRFGMNAHEQSRMSGFPIEEINRGLWPAVEEFLNANPDWVLHERFYNNNGLTILRKV